MPISSRAFPQSNAPFGLIGIPVGPWRAQQRWATGQLLRGADPPYRRYKTWVPLPYIPVLFQHHSLLLYCLLNMDNTFPWGRWDVWRSRPDQHPTDALVNWKDRARDADVSWHETSKRLDNNRVVHTAVPIRKLGLFVLL